MTEIKRITPKHKLWLERRNRKIIRKRKKRQRILTRIIRNIRDEKIPIPRSPKYSSFKAPKVFSFIRNISETNVFFNQVIDQLNLHKYNQTINLDMTEVKTVTTDALMYMLAVIRNLKLKSAFKAKFTGTGPIDKEASRIFLESGFLNYTQSADSFFKPRSKKIQILSGKKVSVDVARNICDFVNDLHGADYKSSKTLYKIIIELMTNTVQHAYNKGTKKQLKKNEWYIFVAQIDEKIALTFLDTGSGIPTTVAKKTFMEKVKLANDSDLIASALKGEWRSETLDDNRGKGLPLIYDSVKKECLKDLRIISERGLCHISDGILNHDVSLSKKVYGTIFNMIVPKG